MNKFQDLGNNSGDRDQNGVAQVSLTPTEAIKAFKIPKKSAIRKIAERSGCRRQSKWIKCPDLVKAKFADEIHEQRLENIQRMDRALQAKIQALAGH